MKRDREWKSFQILTSKACAGCALGHNKKHGTLSYTAIRSKPKGFHFGILNTLTLCIAPQGSHLPAKQGNAQVLLENGVQNDSLEAPWEQLRMPESQAQQDIGALLLLPKGKESVVKPRTD